MGRKNPKEEYNLPKNESTGFGTDVVVGTGTGL
jgi:hypothetical protein